VKRRFSAEGTERSLSGGVGLRLKRAYERPEEGDGKRVLVDRLWPRGLSKQAARIDLWLRDVAPSDELRQWFKHDPEKWDEFKRRYFAELNDRDEQLEELVEAAAGETVTLIFAAKDEDHNNATALKEYLESQRGL